MWGQVAKKAVGKNIGASIVCNCLYWWQECEMTYYIKVYIKYKLFQTPVLIFMLFKKFYYNFKYEICCLIFQSFF